MSTNAELTATCECWTADQLFCYLDNILLQLYQVCMSVSLTHQWDSKTQKKKEEEPAQSSNLTITADKQQRVLGRQ